jgi:hypothetical protein
VICICLTSVFKAVVHAAAVPPDVLSMRLFAAAVCCHNDNSDSQPCTLGVVSCGKVKAFNMTSNALLTQISHSGVKKVSPYLVYKGILEAGGLEAVCCNDYPGLKGTVAFLQVWCMHMRADTPGYLTQQMGQFILLQFRKHKQVRSTVLRALGWDALEAQASDQGGRRQSLSKHSEGAGESDAIQAAVRRAAKELQGKASESIRNISFVRS